MFLVYFLFDHFFFFFFPFGLRRFSFAAFAVSVALIQNNIDLTEAAMFNFDMSKTFIDLCFVFKQLASLRKLKETCDEIRTSSN